jgi:hypothetical protein
MPGLLDKDALHRKGGSGEEVPAILPGRSARVGDQSEAGLVDQPGLLTGLSRRLAVEPCPGEPPPVPFGSLGSNPVAPTLFRK